MMSLLLILILRVWVSSCLMMMFCGFVLLSYWLVLMCLVICVMCCECLMLMFCRSVLEELFVLVMSVFESRCGVVVSLLFLSVVIMVFVFFMIV